MNALYAQAEVQLTRLPAAEAFARLTELRDALEQLRKRAARSRAEAASILYRDMSLSEVAAEIGLTRARADQLVRQARSRPLPARRQPWKPQRDSASGKQTTVSDLTPLPDGNYAEHVWPSLSESMQAVISGAQSQSPEREVVTGHSRTLYALQRRGVLNMLNPGSAVLTELGTTLAEWVRRTAASAHQDIQPDSGSISKETPESP